MKSILDQPTLRRRASLAHAASLGGLLVLLGSVALSLYRPEAELLSALMLFGGFALAMLGIYSANRWVKKPRPEAVLDRALKGLSDTHRLYHYTRLGDHVLLTPNGIVVLETVNLEGRFTYEGGRWRQKMSISRALRYIVEERLGNPSDSASFAASRVNSYLVKSAADELAGVVEAIPVAALVVFTHPGAQVTAKEAPMPVVSPDKLLKKIPHPGQRMQAQVYQHARQSLDALFPASATAER